MIERCRLCPVRPHSTANAMNPVRAGDEGWESPSDSHMVSLMVKEEGDDVKDVVDIDDDAVVQESSQMQSP